MILCVRVVERGRVKCGQYWPLEEGKTEQHGYFMVRTTHIQVFQDFKLSHLKLYNTQVGLINDSWMDLNMFEILIKGTSYYFVGFRLRNLSKLCYLCPQSGEKREVCHYLYLSWPDFGVPKSASAMLDFREHVLQRRATAVQSLGSSWTGSPGGPPVVVHCSAGIGRTGKDMSHFDAFRYIY